MAEALDELIAKLEAAVAGSRGLSWDIADALGWGEVWIGQTIYIPPGEIADRARQDRNSVSIDDLPGDATSEPPRYTTSIDAAMTLVPDDFEMVFAWNRDEREAASSIGVNALSGFPIGEGLAKSLKRENAIAIALCIAALRARATTGEENG